ncbi:hypothetical protein QBC47DRAFT_139276 [Echria macrotheca]|uniref:Secreted protein n=1 Tax=Echria macrotheca TaxID=438768 RepID=A0AAJ0BHH6_9PEZI|nr:hypothetical protein QBC47DRAFT_139276 [Echria macrotheca]
MRFFFLVSCRLPFLDAALLPRRVSSGPAVCTGLVRSGAYRGIAHIRATLHNKQSQRFGCADGAHTATRFKKFLREFHPDFSKDQEQAETPSSHSVPIP